jgi:hypothetical protein
MGCNLPADFTPEEAEFSAALREFFAPEREELPPLYVQTLTGDARQAAVESSFEQRMAYQVFRRLRLHRRPLFDTPAPAPAWAAALSPRRLGRLGGALVTCVLALVLTSVVLAGPSFADGLRLLLGHAGVQQVNRYPSGVRPSASMVHTATNGDADPLTTLEWFGPSVGTYTYQDTRMGAAQEWSDGPVAEIQYVCQGTTPGSGLLDIREFRPAANLAAVLQVVADGSVTPVNVAGQPAVYVDGRWVRYGRHMDWQSGSKGELILEQGGLILWIVGDPRDGTSMAQLTQFARKLQPVSGKLLLPNQPTLRAIGVELQETLQNPGTDEVLDLVPLGGSPENLAGAFVTIAPVGPGA